MFAEKLDFLMKLTGARNSALGRAAHVDASTVSRLRAGKRKLPRSQNFLPLMCDYFARAIVTPLQRRSAADAICPGLDWPREREQASRLTLAWLCDEPPAEGGQISRLVSGMASFSFRAPDAPTPDAWQEPPDASAVSLLYGDGGKREAVARFLTEVLRSPRTHTLLLYSDEPMDWLTQSAAFARQWSSLMQGALAAGHRVRIIHSVGRTLDEMLEGLNKWIGLYMTGGVEPYYCPRLRDGVSRRTLFVAPGLAAVSATRMGGGTEEGLTLYVREPRALRALEAEFASYLALCRPLMRILTAERRGDARALLRGLMDAPGEAVLAQGAPCLGVMPEAVARGMQARLGGTLAHACADARGAFRRSVAASPVIDIFPLVSAADFRTQVVAPPDAFFARSGACYTQAEYAAHLAAVADALLRYPNYHVLLCDASALPGQIALYCKPRVGVLLARADDPPIAFAINEPAMTEAFREYLAPQTAQAQKPAARRKVVQRLREAVRAMGEGEDEDAGALPQTPAEG